MERKVYTTQEAAEILGVHSETVRRLVQRGELQAIRLGWMRSPGGRRGCSMIRIPKDAVDRLLKGGESGGEDSSTHIPD